MAKPKSRPARWAEAVDGAKEAYESVISASEILSERLTELKDIQDEYVEWRENLSENLESSPVAEKLDAVMEIDIESVMDEPLDNWGDVESAIGEAENADLPLGFGRD